MDKKQRDFIGYQIFIDSNSGNDSGGSDMGCGTFLVIMVVLSLIGSCVG